MAIHTDRITLVFPLAAKGRAAAASLQTLEITDSGAEIEKIVPLNPAAINAYAPAFQLDLIQKVTDLTAQLTAANAKITSLTAQVPFNVRRLSRSGFRRRLFEFIPNETVFELIRDDAKGVEFKRISRILGDQKDNQAVDLDSQQVTKLLGDLVSIGLLTTEQIAAIRVDATSQEAFIQ